jgi:ABC-2 type transport system permease protein
MADLSGPGSTGAGDSGSDASELDIPMSSIAGGGLLGPLARAQYGALARLRWRMFVNSLRTNKGALEFGARIFTSVVYAVLGLCVGTGAGFATYFLVSHEKWRLLPILFWVLAFLWQVIPVMLASFQEQFDLGILLRFPVRFGSYMLLYMVFGLVDISTILGGLCSAGIWVGVAVARPDLLLWTTVALAVFAAFNILLVRAVFAWIERWLAQRRTREILGAVFMVLLLSMQVFNPALYQKRGSGHRGGMEQAEQLRQANVRYAPILKQVNAVQKWLPPGLAAQAMRQAGAQQPGEGVLSIGVLGLYALLVGGILAVRLKAEYRGENLGAAPARDKVAKAKVRTPAASAASVPIAVSQSGFSSGIYGPMAAIIEKDLRSLLRTLPLLYAIGAPLLLVLVFSGIFIKNGAPEANMFPLALPACLVYAQLGFTQIFYNNLGTEGAGIQLYFLSPTPMRTVMLAKNLLHSLLFGMVALVAALLAVVRLGMPDMVIVAATAAWLLYSLPCNLAAGILFSLKMPYRVNPGRISRQRGSQGNALLSLLVQLAFLVAAAAVFALGWFLGKMWITIPIFLGLAAGAFFVWWQVLGNADATAFERRDKLMATLMKES